MAFAAVILVLMTATALVAPVALFYALIIFIATLVHLGPSCKLQNGHASARLFSMVRPPCCLARM